MINEHSIIELAKASFPEYIGDDAAVLPYTTQSKYLLSKDLLIEDVHFRTSYFTPYDLAHKSLNVNLSDISAMGAKPTFVMLAASVPKNLLQYAVKFLQSFNQLCKEKNIILIGGDTTAGDKLCISVTAIGIADNNHIKLRSTAQPEEIICVIGNLGFSYLGLNILENHNAQNISLNSEILNASLRPNALINEGIWLGKQNAVTSMMDISDGLYVDLQKLCQASNIGAEIEVEKLQLKQSFITQCATLNMDPITTALLGGEDYALLVTIDASKYQEIATNFYTNFGYKMTDIGKINQTKKVIFTKNQQQLVHLDIKTFSHFE